MAAVHLQCPASSAKPCCVADCPTVAIPCLTGSASATNTHALWRLPLHNRLIAVPFQHTSGASGCSFLELARGRIARMV